MRMLLAISIAGLLIPLSRGSGAVDVRITPAIREYCHIVRFPQGWIAPPPLRKDAYPPFYGFDSSYEFRIPGVLETTFIVAGVVLPEKQYTVNKYRVDLSDPKAIAWPVTEREWQDGTKAPVTKEDIYLPHLTNDQPVNFHGFQFTKTGDIWPGQNSRVSPDKSWIVLLSSSGKTAKRGDIFFTGRDNGKLFFDVFNADTGKKLATIVGAYVDVDPGNAINQAIWVTERYFVIPLGDHRERCVVCEFGRARRDGEVKR